MKIAQIAPLIERVPPKQYGGTERVVYALTEELVARGHEVTLFASGDSITSARLVSIRKESLREVKMKYPYPSNLWTMANMGIAYRYQHEFDIIHDHNGVVSTALAGISQTPVVLTLHGAFNPKSTEIFRILGKNLNFVSISNSQRKPLPHLSYTDTVYNGLPMDHYPFSKTHDGYLLFVGRISKEKGLHRAIEVSRKTKIPLIIAAKLEDYNMDYFKKSIKPFLSDSIRWIGEVDENKRNKLMSKALCFLHPITWREPFGLTLIEAMACGTPVVAFNKGAIPEVVKHGKTGFTVNSMSEMIHAVKQIDSIDRTYCREYALSNFSAKKMADGYEEVYKKILLQQYRQPAAQYIRHGLLKDTTLPKSLHELFSTD